MALDITNPDHSYRPIGMGLVGILLMMLSGFVVYDVLQRKADASEPTTAYEYKVSQSIDPSITYFNSSFFDTTPGTNTAFVSSLTNTLGATFHYNYHAAESTELTYAYEVKATVRGTFSLQNNGQAAPASNVWNKEYQLVPPTKQTLVTNDIVLSPKVVVPYADYKKNVEDLKEALSLPLTSEVAIQYLIRVSGTIGGTPFEDTRTSSVTASLDQQIYALSIKYDKADSKRVSSQEAQKSRSTFEQYETIIAGVLGVIGVALLGFGLRKQIFKTPYQRELDRIYRYHDGIIIKASTETDVTGKNIVPVLSFDDMLNLEEELKAPIVASPAGGEATRFMIVRDDVVYVYTLGKVLLRDEKIIEEIDIDDINTRAVKHKK